MSTDKQNAGKPGRPSRTIDEEIAATETRLRQLREKKRDDERKELERNQRAIMAVLREADLDHVPATAWKSAIPAIGKLLHPSPASGGGSKAPAPAPPPSPALAIGAPPAAASGGSAAAP